MVLYSNPTFPHFFPKPPPRKEPPEPAVTRSSQIEQKPEPGRGRGRGKGRGKGRGGGRGSRVKEYQEGDEEWHWEPGLGWFWVGTEKQQKKRSTPKRKAKKLDKEEKVETTKKQRKKKGQTVEEKQEKPTEKPKKRKSQTTDGEEPKKRSTKTKKELKPIEPPPFTKKEQRKEILAFLEAAKDFTDENARASLKGLLPNYGAHNFDCSPDIYWERKGVKGIGCGVRCHSEGKNVGYFGYRVQCDSWIFAIAAAIKSADIFATFLHSDGF